MNDLLTELAVLGSIEDGKVADFSNGEARIDLTEAPKWGIDKIIRSGFIRRLCTDPEKIRKLTLYGLHIRGARIEEPLNLSSLQIPFKISLNECYIPKPIDLRSASIKELNLDGSRTGKIDADSLIVNGDLRLSEGFWAEGPVSLTMAKIKGDLSCANARFDNNSDQHYITENNICNSCRANTLHIYSLVLERAAIKGSLYLCGGFFAQGGVNLSDSTIGINLNCTKGRFNAKAGSNNRRVPQNTGQRLTCNSEHEYHCASAFYAEGLHVKGSVIMQGVEIHGETRMTGARIGGDLDSAGGQFLSHGISAIHADRLHVNGNIYFCGGFKADGIIRLPRADIGADLSFCDSSIKNSFWKGFEKDLKREPPYIVYCEGAKIQGSVYMKKVEVDDGSVDLSYCTVGGNLDCTSGKFISTKGHAIKGIGMDINGSVFFSSLEEGGPFQANSLICLTGSKLGMNLICTNGHFKSDSPCDLEDNTPCAIKANNMTIAGKVEMNNGFRAEGGVNLDYTNIGSYFDCTNGTFNAPNKEKYPRQTAISGSKLYTGGNIIFSDNFSASGMVKLSDASIGKNLICNSGKIEKNIKYSLYAPQINVMGSIEMNDFVSIGEVCIDHAVIGGNLSCNGSRFINNK